MGAQSSSKSSPCTGCSGPFRPQRSYLPRLHTPRAWRLVAEEVFVEVPEASCTTRPSASTTDGAMSTTNVGITDRLFASRGSVATTLPRAPSGRRRGNLPLPMRVRVRARAFGLAAQSPARSRSRTVSYRCSTQSCRSPSTGATGEGDRDDSGIGTRSTPA